MNNAKYVVFDGMDGAGKGTHLKLLQQTLGSSVTFTYEPGGTPFADEIRKIVRDNPLAGQSTPLNNFLLFWASREELQHNLVAPALRSGKHVFSDRGDSSTFGFQMEGEEHQEFFELFMDLRRRVFESPGRRAPDHYVVFDLPAEVARERALQDATRTPTHFDIRDLAFYQRVRAGFHTFAKHYGPVTFIDATTTVEEVHMNVLEALRTLDVFA